MYIVSNVAPHSENVLFHVKQNKNINNMHITLSFNIMFDIRDCLTYGDIFKKCIMDMKINKQDDVMECFQRHCTFNKKQ